MDNAMKLNGIELQHTNMRDVFVDQAKLGDKPLLICEGETLTYADADERSNRIASSLAGFGIGKGDVVATFLYNSVDHAAIWYACVKLGAVFASLNVSLAPNELVYSLGDTGAKLIVVDNELLDLYEKARPNFDDGLIEVLWRGADRSDYLAYPRLLDGDDVLPEVVLAPNDPMSIIYTGGSTSMPKGVLAPHLYYVAAAERYKEITQSQPDDVHFANSHLFHVGGQQFGIMGPLYCGTTGVMAKWFSVSKYWSLARETGATIIDPIGTMISALLSLPPSSADRDHQVRVGIGIASGQVRSDFRSNFETRFEVPLLEVYAMTEVGVLLCSERLDDKTVDSCGKTNGWADILIVDEEESPVPTGEQGQILLRPTATNTMMLEYINKPAETIAAWRNLWYHSGDIGYLDDDGCLHFVGRQAHWVRVRGENVSAFEVEKVLSAHDAVDDCAVVGVPGELGEEDIKAYVQLVSGSSIDPAELVAWCREQLAYFKVPRYVEFVEEFPRTITKQEIERFALRSQGIGDAWDREAP
ncbi:MAG: crotonobetaine/carnitine-CoA ligase [Acidimicrobiales bacterium]|jgi:crotonobetaine/carnitine-CoA ligase